MENTQNYGCTPAEAENQKLKSLTGEILTFLLEKDLSFRDAAYVLHDAQAKLYDCKITAGC